MSIHTITIPTKNECRASECELKYSRHQKGVQGCYYKPSIHTILSQEIARFYEEFMNPDKFSSVHQFRPEYEGRLPEKFEAFLRSFATRIVEEAQREERERIMEIDINPEGRHCRIGELFGDLIEDCTKLQKMKDGDKHE